MPVTITSDNDGDTVAGNDVTFGYDLADGNAPITRTLTFTSGGVTTTLDVSVASPVDSIELVVAPTARQGRTVTVIVNALDADGTDLGDVTVFSTIESAVATDEVNGDRVTFPTASPHVLRATYGTLTASATVEVSASPASGLPPTGSSASTAAAVALLLLVVGITLVLVDRRRHARDEHLMG